MTFCRIGLGYDYDYEDSVYTVVFYQVAKGGALRDYAYAIAFTSDRQFLLALYYSGEVNF